MVVSYVSALNVFCVKAFVACILQSIFLIAMQYLQVCI